MKLSARNQLKGKILKVDEGLITSKVMLDLDNGNIISAIISKDAIADLDMKAGDTAFPIIKSTLVTQQRTRLNFNYKGGILNARLVLQDARVFGESNTKQPATATTGSIGLHVSRNGIL